MVYDRPALAEAARRGISHPGGGLIRMDRLMPYQLLTEFLPGVQDTVAAGHPLAIAQLEYLWAEEAVRNGMAALHLIYLLQPADEDLVLRFIPQLVDLTSRSPPETSRWVHQHFVLKMKLDWVLSYFYPRISRAFAEADLADATTDQGAGWMRESRLWGSFLRLMNLTSRAPAGPEAPYDLVPLSESRFSLL